MPVDRVGREPILGFVQSGALGHECPLVDGRWFGSTLRFTRTNRRPQHHSEAAHSKALAASETLAGCHEVNTCLRSDPGSEWRRQTVRRWRSTSSATRATSRALESGEVLFREGDPGDTMFAVTEGQIALAARRRGPRRRRARRDPRRDGPHRCSPRSATATATTPTRVVAVDQKHFTYLVHEHPTFALQVMTIMAERLRRTNG